MGNIIESLRDDPDLTKRLLTIHLKKPEKVDLFFKAFHNFTKTGILKYSLSFSFWGFLGNFWFYIYRKMYVAAVVFFFLPWSVYIFDSIFYTVMVFITRNAEFTTTLAVVFTIYPLLSKLINLVIYIIPGFTGIYLYIKKFLKDLKLAGFETRETNEDFELNLSLLGGYNKWALVVPVVISIISVLIIVILGFIVAIKYGPLRY